MLIGSGCFGAGFGEGEPLVADVGDDFQVAAEGFEVGGQGAQFGSKIYRMRISLRPAEPGRSSFRLLSREWWTRLASGRPSFEQHADGLANLNRTGAVTLAQIVQPCPHLRCHNQK